MSARSAAGQVPDLLLERYRLGELGAVEAEALARRLGEDPELRSRLEALERSDADVRRRLPAGLLADGVRSRLLRARPPAGPSVRARVQPWPLVVAASAAAALLLALSTHVLGPSPDAGPGRVAVEAGGERVKGLKPALALFRKTRAGSEALSHGDSARTGDLIRVGYRAAGRGFGVIVSIDGRGSVTVHLPEQGRSAAPLTPGGNVLLAHAYELDDAPRFERFYFVTSASSFEVATVVEAARRAAAAAASPDALPLPPSLEQCAFSLSKER